MARAFQSVVLISFAFALVACGGRVRRDFSAGGVETDVLILQDRPAVELSIWEGAIVFDLRDYSSWAQGHIHGARRVTVEDLKMGRGLPDDRSVPVLFMGDGLLDSRPELAAQTAVELGYTNVQLFPGGWRMWIGAHPIRDE